MNRNFRTPYVTNWTVGIQHAFSGKLTMESTYVGNHAVKLPGVYDVNQPPAGSGWSPADIAGCVAAAYAGCGANGTKRSRLVRSSPTTGTHISG